MRTNNNLNNEWSKTVNNSRQLLQIKEELANFISVSEISTAEKTLIITAVLEICRSFLDRFTEFDTRITRLEHNETKKFIIKFHANCVQYEFSSSKENSSQFFPNAKINRFKTIFDEISQYETDNNSTYNLTLIKRYNV